MAFIGRRADMAELDALLDDVHRGRHAAPGVVVVMRGGPRVGKSRLAAEFIRNASAPAVHFHAPLDAPATWQFRAFAEAIAESTLPEAEAADVALPTSITDAFELLAAAVPADQPSIVVVDDAAHFLAAVPGGLRELQRAWERQLADRPVLLVLISGDPVAARDLLHPVSPWHGRVAEMVVDPLTPAELMSLIGLDPVHAIDAYLITGGLPSVALEWETGMPPRDFLRESFSWSTSALVIAGARILDAELPDMQYARAVLSAIGSLGERTFTGILNAVSGGVMSRNSLTASLEALAASGLIVADKPLSTLPAPKDRRWRVADPALRFWLAFVEPALNDVDCDRPEVPLRAFDAGYTAWRHRAVQPVVHSALERLLPDAGWPEVHRVGSWWPRSNSPEVTLVAADDAPAHEVACAGGIWWRPDAPVTADEIARIRDDVSRVPGADASTPLILVSASSGAADDRLARAWTAEDLLAAWT